MMRRSRSFTSTARNAPCQAVTALAALLAVALALLDSGTVFARAAQFRAGVHVVELNVRALANRKAVIGLGATDFVVRDNGAIQRVSSVSRDALPIDLTVLVDMSETQSRVLIGSVNRAIGRIRDQLGTRDRVSILTFGDRIRTLASRVTPDQAGRMKLGEPGNWGTHTPLHDALAVALATPVEPGRRHLAVVFADGADDGSFLSERDVLDLAGRSSCVVFAVSRVAEGWGLASFPRAIVDHPERRAPVLLEQLATSTGGQVKKADATIVDRPTANSLSVRANPNLIDGAFTDAVDEFRSGYSLRYALDAPPSPGWHDVTVSVRDHPEYVVRTRAGYRLD